MEGIGMHTVLGLEIKIQTTGIYSLRYALLRKTKSTLELVGSKVVEGSLVKVIESLPKKYPVAICITGSGVLSKLIQSEKNTTKEGILQAAFPTLNADEFYIQQYAEDKISWIGMARKSSIDPVLDILERSACPVLRLSVGPAPLLNARSYLKKQAGELAFDGHCISLGGHGQLTGYQFSADQTHDELDQEIPGRVMLSYCCAMQLLMWDQLEQIAVEEPVIAARLQDHLSGHELRRNGMLLCLALFISLLISFIVFSYYNEQNTILGNRAGEIVSTEEQLELRQRIIAGNIKCLQQLGWNGGYNYGFLVDQIGSGKPRGVILKEIVMANQPLPSLQSAPGTFLHISAMSTNLMAVNNWVFALREKDWIRSVKLERFQESPSAAEAYQFILKIEY